MVERILEVTRIKKVEYYNPNQQFFGNSLKQNAKMDFQNILERKMKKAQVSDPYRLSISKKKG